MAERSLQLNYRQRPGKIGKMPEEIEAAPPTLRIPSYRTPGSAIEQANRYAREHQKEGVELCVGQKIDFVERSDVAIRLNLDNLKSIEFECVGRGFDYSIIEGSSRKQLSPTEIGDIVSMKLGQRSFIWKHRALLEQLQGNKFQKIFPSPIMLFVYVSNFGILGINTLINRSTDRPFLFWEITD